MCKLIQSGRGRICCQECGAELRPWEDVYSWDTDSGEELICEDCFDGMFGELSRHERAELIGSRVTRAEDIGA